MALSRILVIGGTGRIGQHIVEASIRAGHPTLMLLRPATADSDSDSEKAKLVQALKNAGAVLVYGDIEDHESLVMAIKRVDVVISALGHCPAEEIDNHIKKQLKIVAAIKEAGNIQRYVPSEFGYNVELVALTEPGKTILSHKLRTREVLRAEGIPYTIICNHWIQGFLLPRMGNPEVNASTPPTDQISILGDGNSPQYLVNERDIGTCTIKAINDHRTINKILYVRPSKNLCSINKMISLWEKKIGKNLKKDYVSEEEILKKIREFQFPLNFQIAMVHSTFVKGYQSEFAIDSSDALEATQLYPDVQYITVEEYLDSLLESTRP